MKNRMIPPPTDLMKFLVSPKMEMNFFILADDHIIMCNTPFLMDTVRQQKLCKSTDPERISSRRRIVIPCPLRIEPERQAKQAMRLILGNQWAAISSRRRIVIPCHLRIEAKREERLASASLRVDPLNGMLRKRRTRSTKRLYQRKGLGLQIPKKSCSSAGLRERRALI